MVEFKIGERIYEGLQPGQKQHFLNALVAMVTLTIYVGWMNFFLLLCISAFFSRTALYIVIALLSTLALPARPVLWPWFNRLWVFKTWREYFRYSFLFEEKLERGKKYVLAEFPHGSFPIGPIVAGTLVQTMFPDDPVYSVAASSVFYIPLWRHFISWIGSLPATKENFKKLLHKGSLAVVVGGIAEMYMLDPRKERIKLKGRKGFAKIAVEEKADGIVPVYYFGNSRCLEFGPQWLSDMSRKLRVSLGYLHGRWGLPLPRAVPIYLVHGKPVPVPKVDKSDKIEFEKAVDQLHDAFMLELQSLYDRHKGEYGWSERPLSIE
ncbi:hypothetical protein CEUSTIGMA_g10214.t1 [Chlamydomonas eustigma]|uniref:Acyltransferase n=1 Tax=Chlamydomonas eustigma TaxID=1157962 RepID=A0A250XI88_9CHLO|nr:hypothetical protein CEUSTIGMA_g10214.t1 [Chlamydomonas eustigma]|eukprot:GAX82788.1 hypothetical protein CEUSTIGMA_g10214.t1 [Chlamydomonas eustigma]